MVRGLLWLPLLVVFFWLAWAGWNEYQKLEAYRRWAESFQRAKYDIYAVLAQQDDCLTWGKPTRSGPIELQTFSLRQVQALNLLVDGQPIALDQPLEQARQVALAFDLENSASPVCIPFTELSLALQWGQHLQRDWQILQAGGQLQPPAGASPG